MQTGDGTLSPVVGTDRTSAVSVAQLVAKDDRKTAWELLEHMPEIAPYEVKTVLADIGTRFAEQSRNRNTISCRPLRFDTICEARGIEHRLTRPSHPWSNGPVERMKRTITDATVKRFLHETRDRLRTQLTDFPEACTVARRLKTPGGLAPGEDIRKSRTSDPDRSILELIHRMPGMNT